MQTIATFVILAVVGVIVYDFAIEYAKAGSSGWQRIWDAWSGGAANLKRQLGIVAAGAVAFSSKITDWVCSLLNDPSAADSVKSIISGYVTPATVGTAMAIFTLISIAAKLRKH